MTKDNRLSDKKIVYRTLPGLIIFLAKETLRQRKWILLPLLALLVAIVLIILFSGSSFILPAIYIVGF